jgi:hypothetical protein
MGNANIRGGIYENCFGFARNKMGDVPLTGEG